MRGITVYVPCYNGARFIEGCLGALNRQTRRPDEIVVIDDGSADGSGDLAEKLGARVIRQPRNLGLGAGRNLAFHKARHDLVASIDADCVADPDWLGALEKALTAEYVGVGGLLSETFFADAADLWRKSHMKQHWGERRVENPPFLFGNNNLFRREAILDAGGYDERLKTNYEDVDMSERLKKKGHRILYEPAARVAHMRRDTIKSVLNAYWRWTLWDCVEPTDFGLALKKAKFNVGRSRGFAIEDLKNGNARLLAIDAAMPFYHTWLDFRHALNSRKTR